MVATFFPSSDQDRHPADRVHHASPSERPLQADVLTPLHLLDRDGAGAAHLRGEHDRAAPHAHGRREASTAHHGVVAHHADAALAEQHLACGLEAHRAGVRRGTLGLPSVRREGRDARALRSAGVPPGDRERPLGGDVLAAASHAFGVDVGGGLVLGDREAGPVLQTELLQGAVLGERVQRAARRDREVTVDRRERSARVADHARSRVATRSRRRPSRCRSCAAWTDRA